MFTPSVLLYLLLTDKSCHFSADPFYLFTVQFQTIPGIFSICPSGYFHCFYFGVSCVPVLSPCPCAFWLNAIFIFTIFSPFCLDSFFFFGGNVLIYPCFLNCEMWLLICIHWQWEAALLSMIVTIIAAALNQKRLNRLELITELQGQGGTFDHMSSSVTKTSIMTHKLKKYL